mmetsp:Transcript_102473/g.258165  ORF Transcript_102473/g.258165 Transcript_102473/m.258165 type:complete len:560 (-) Transcript_102473:218-1897(-)
MEKLEGGQMGSSVKLEATQSADGSASLSVVPVEDQHDSPHRAGGVISWQACVDHRDTLLIVGAWAVWLAYVIAACVVNFHRARLLLALTLVALVFRCWSCLSRRCDWSLGAVVDSVQDWARSHPRTVCLLSVVALVVASACWITIDVWMDPRRLIPVAGLLVMVGGLYVSSQHRQAVKWRPVISGILMQLTLGVIILRTEPGYEAFRWFSELVQTFFSHADAGSRFVFGENYEQFFFAFKVLPVIIYFGSIVSVAYHVGLLQHIFAALSVVLQCILGTSAAESFVAAANIFIGQTEAPLLIRPFLKDLTSSEMHCVMTCGFATIAGGVLAAYISFGVPAQHLVAASVLSCPAALAAAKLSYPETEELKLKVSSAADVVAAAECSNDHNIVDAAVNGALAAVNVVVGVAAGLIAFLSIWSLLDGTVAWAGEMVDIEGLSIEVICSYAFWPLAFLMGVPAEDCSRVALLLGEKTFINEFVAYKHLAEHVANGDISLRAEVIATYALCGFSNIGSVGIMLGSLGPLVPERRGEMAGVVGRAMVCGNMACFMTACVAGMLYSD